MSRAKRPRSRRKQTPPTKPEIPVDLTFADEDDPVVVERLVRVLADLMGD